MALKIIKIEPRLARIVFLAIVLLSLALAWFCVRWNFANMIALRLDRAQPESKIVADYLTQIGPNDPLTHFAAAAVLEKTFDPGDLERSLIEYERAAALSPHNYLLWLTVARARAAIGDADGAEAAYERAQTLAPNYSAVDWQYGNFLVRQGRADEGFALVAKAAASNSDYTRPAAITALQFFDGDVARARAVLGGSDPINAALTTTLAAEKRFSEAVDCWSRIDAELKKTAFRTIGESLAAQLAEAKQFQLAAIVTADLADENEKPVIGQLSNGGFENGVKLRDARLFEWRIAEGAAPQIGLSESQQRSGKYSLSLVFNSFERSAFRDVSQTVAVAPGASYEFQAFYRADLKTDASFRWEVVDAAASQVIAQTAPLALAGDWATLRVAFTVPQTSDGILVRFAREGCPGLTCPAAGRISFDDISIRRL